MSHLKINDTMKMKFRSTVSDYFIQILEIFKEFIRDTATVTIVKRMSVTVLFVHVYKDRQYTSECVACNLTIIVPPIT